jgi:hypothetical protein
VALKDDKAYVAAQEQIVRGIMMMQKKVREAPEES